MAHVHDFMNLFEIEKHRTQAKECRLGRNQAKHNRRFRGRCISGFFTIRKPKKLAAKENKIGIFDKCSLHMGQLIPVSCAEIF